VRARESEDGGGGGRKKELMSCIESSADARPSSSRCLVNGRRSGIWFGRIFAPPRLRERRVEGRDGRRRVISDSKRRR